MRQAIVESIAAPRAGPNLHSACLQCASSVRPVCLQSSRRRPAPARRARPFASPSVLVRFSFDCPSMVPGVRPLFGPRGCGTHARARVARLHRSMSGGVGLPSISPAVGSMVPGRVAPVNVPLARVPRSYAAPQAPRLGFAGFDCLVTYRGGAPRLHQGASVRPVVCRALRAQFRRAASPWTSGCQPIPTAPAFAPGPQPELDGSRRTRERPRDEPRRRRPA